MCGGNYHGSNCCLAVLTEAKALLLSFAILPYSFPLSSFYAAVVGGMDSSNLAFVVSAVHLSYLCAFRM